METGAVITATSGQAPAEQVSRRSVVVLAAALLLPVLAYTLTVLVPFATSDLDELPLPELAAGALAPGWPHSGALDLAGVAALVLVLLGALLSLGGAALQLLALLPADRRTLTPWVAAALALVAVGSVATLYWFLSPLGSALTSWQLD
ncbi:MULTISPECIES: hypothetical protein [Modestobacter]|jgi:peptidoglycan/LPS O-acetylase OafA/YrhL|uniref:hypothetical protein n=1 Tax=Modestobacter TaxID=88138 RepID=UPI0012E07B19|nr:MULTISPECIES: hypothetical protein [Modestobacter]